MSLAAIFAVPRMLLQSTSKYDLVALASSVILSIATMRRGGGSSRKDVVIRCRLVRSQSRCLGCDGYNIEKGPVSI